MYVNIYLVLLLRNLMLNFLDSAFQISVRAGQLFYFVPQGISTVEYK